MLEVLELPYDPRHVTVLAQEQFDPAFLVISPLGKVRMLESPQLDRPLAKSGAILHWLGSARDGSARPGRLHAVADDPNGQCRLDAALERATRSSRTCSEHPSWCDSPAGAICKYLCSVTLTFVNGPQAQSLGYVAPDPR